MVFFHVDNVFHFWYSFKLKHLGFEESYTSSNYNKSAGSTHVNKFKKSKRDTYGGVTIIDTLI